MINFREIFFGGLWALSSHTIFYTFSSKWFSCVKIYSAPTYIQFLISEHLGLALALNVPVFVVITKIDMCPPNVLQETIKLLNRVLKSPGCRKIPMMIQNKDDVVVSASNFVSER